MDPLRILVVDDNHINRLYLTTILTQWHHHVTEVDSGEAALSVARNEVFDLILMDIRMQPMDGFTAAKKIKQMDHHKNICMVAVSAEFIDCQQYPQFNLCLIKPLNKEVLSQLLEQITRQVNKNDTVSVVFDEHKALAISHQDSDIVHKIRGLFVAGLHTALTRIEELYQNQLWQELDHRLHDLQGSARICAASQLVKEIKLLRSLLAEPSTDAAKGQLRQLKKAAEDILTYSNKVN